MTLMVIKTLERVSKNYYYIIRGENIESAEYDLGNKYFPLVIIYEDDRSDVVYDKNTNVMYYIYHNYDKYGITPIYNSDGSVKLYEE